MIFLGNFRFIGGGILGNLTKNILALHCRDTGDADLRILLYFDFNSKNAPFITEHIIDNDSSAGLNIPVKDTNKAKNLNFNIAIKNGVF